MGPECLYLVTNDKSYKTFGDVVGNGWQLGVVTGGEKSGSFGTWKVLQGVYPDLEPMAVTHVAAIGDIITAVKQKKDVVGFFVMRPDPDSDVFKSIADASLTIVPVVDFDLEDKDKFMSLKVSHGWSGGKEVQTACTTVALITAIRAARSSPTIPISGVSPRPSNVWARSIPKCSNPTPLPGETCGTA